MTTAGRTYYQRDLALVHHLGFGVHADTCAPGILELLAPVRSNGGLVVELGCGSGLLTRHLVDAGHRVVATDASPAMVELARRHVPEADSIEQLTRPDDPSRPADAIVSVGHVVNYLPDEAAIDRALVAIAEALRPGGVVIFDVCDLAGRGAAWGTRLRASHRRVGDRHRVRRPSAEPVRARHGGVRP